jgi:hypothetical protein
VLRPSQRTVCGHCGAVAQIDFFPALLQDSIGKPAENVVLETESSCFFHPAKRAVTACQGCGRFLCSLCDVDMGGQRLCPRCIEQGAKADSLEPLRTEFTRYDHVALALAIVPMIFFFITIITAPIAIYVCLKYRNAPISAVPRGKMIFRIAFCLALLQLVAWTLAIGSAFF